MQAFALNLKIRHFFIRLVSPYNKVSFYPPPLSLSLSLSLFLSLSLSLSLSLTHPKLNFSLACCLITFLILSLINVSSHAIICFLFISYPSFIYKLFTCVILISFFLSFFVCHSLFLSLPTSFAIFSSRGRPLLCQCERSSTQQLDEWGVIVRECASGLKPRREKWKSLQYLIRLWVHWVIFTTHISPRLRT